MFAMSACGAKDESAESNIIYGQVIKTDEKTITVENGKYKENGKFRGYGEERSYNLPENVFYDDFKKGDIVIILVDGDEAVSVTEAEKPDLSEETDSGQIHPSVTGEIIADKEEKEIYDKKYHVKGNDKAVVLALNNKGDLKLDRITASTDGKRSVGMCASGGGRIEGNQVSITTVGSRSPGIETYDYKSFVELDRAVLRTESDESPCVFSSGNISLAGADGVSERSSAVVINEGGVVNLKDSEITSKGAYAVEFYCNQERLRQPETSKLISDGSVLTSGSGDAFMKVSGVSGLAKFVNSRIFSDSKVLAEVSSNEQGRGGDLLLYGVNQIFKGDIKCDKLGKVKVVLKEGSSFTGSLNELNTAKYSNIYISKDSTWTLTGDSYVNSVENVDSSCSNINSGGYDIYYDKKSIANDWIGGGVLKLPGGGRLIPVN